MKKAPSTAVSITAFVILILAGTFAVLRYGVQPRSLEIITPSSFARPAEIGAVMFRRLYEPLISTQLVVIGIPPVPESHKDFINGFLDAAKAEKHPYDIVFKEPQWNDPQLIGDAKIVGFDFNLEDVDALVKQVRDAMAGGKRVLIYTVSIYSTHLIPGNAMQRFETAWGSPIGSITTGPLATRYEEEGLIDPVCVGAMRDREGLYPFGCAMLRESRNAFATIRKKHFKHDVNYLAISSQQGSTDYLVQFNGPGGDAGKAWTPAAQDNQNDPAATAEHQRGMKAVTKTSPALPSPVK
jgi:hypothetical protein